jgi:hypothetical protein
VEPHPNAFVADLLAAGVDPAVRLTRERVGGGLGVLVPGNDADPVEVAVATCVVRGVDEVLAAELARVWGVGLVGIGQGWPLNVVLL